VIIGRPLLALGLPPVSANVTNTVALVFTAAGSGRRRDRRAACSSQSSSASMLIADASMLIAYRADARLRLVSGPAGRQS